MENLHESENKLEKDEHKEKKNKLEKVKKKLKSGSKKAANGARKAVTHVKDWDRRVLLIVVSIVVLIVFALGISGFGVYKFGWDNKFANGLMSAIPYPAAMVDGKIITYHDWKFETDAGVMFNQKRFGEADVLEIQAGVLDKLTQEIILRKIAKGFDVKVTEEDLQEKINGLADQQEGPEKLEQEIKDLFGWDLNVFSERIIYPIVLEEKLRSEISGSEKAQAAVEKEAKMVLKLVNSGDKSFEDLAIEFSDDPGSGEQGGDLGWFPKGVMVQEFEDVAFAMEVGTVSDLVKTQFGYHIIKVEEKKEFDEAEEGMEEMVHARHILISPTSFDEYMAEYMDEAKIWKFVDLD
ncbi:peptidylprolyl isomerase [Candidatus Kuenenbacteria bacterium]|nr:peptidylprolyl isomerase [Candidatus Kuenenbacteria bacterium]